MGMEAQRNILGEPFCKSDLDYCLTWFYDYKTG